MQVIEILKNCAGKITNSSTKERLFVCRELVSCVARDGKLTTRFVLLFVKLTHKM